MKRWLIFFMLIIGLLLTGCEYGGHNYEVLGYCEQDGLYYYTKDGVVQSTDDPGMFESRFYGHSWCPSVPGCTDPAAENFNPDATVDDGSCIYYEVCSEQIGPVFGAWSDWVLVSDTWERSRSVTFYDVRNQQHACSSDMEYEYRDATQGCTDPVAENYNPEAEYDDGSCEYYQVCDEQTDPVYGNWSEWALVGDEWVRSRTVTIYDAQNTEHICSTRTETEYKDAIGGCTDEDAENYNPDAEYDDGSCEYYQVCSVTNKIIGEWADWYLEDGIWFRHRLIEYFDSRDPEHECDQQIETEERAAIYGCTDPEAMNYNPAAELDDGSCTYPKPVCPLQLLISYSPPEGWLPYCMVLTESGVSVERQPAICGAGVVEWVADNQPCGGMVYDDGTEYGYWACDRYGYYRQPICVLKCLWARHLRGQRDQESFDKCHGVERPDPPQPVGGQ